MSFLECMCHKNTENLAISSSSCSLVPECLTEQTEDLFAAGSCNQSKMSVSLGDRRPSYLFTAGSCNQSKMSVSLRDRRPSYLFTAGSCSQSVSLQNVCIVKRSKTQRPSTVGRKLLVVNLDREETEHLHSGQLLSMSFLVCLGAS